jgi:hypothetical protein
MAESAVFLFDSKKVEEVEKIFNFEFSEGTSKNWAILDSKGEYLVLIYPDDTIDYMQCLEDETGDFQEKITDFFGDKLPCVYQFEIRRSRSNSACNVITDFALKLKSIEFLVDDCLGKIWTRDEILNSKTFLEQYRYGK